MEYLLKMLFFANIASNLKVESMHFAHRNCEYILGVIYAEFNLQMQQNSD